MVQQWYPDFDCDMASIMKVQIWIRVSKHYMVFFYKNILSKIGNQIGCMLRVDKTTYYTDRLQFSRVRIEINLRKLIQSRFYFRGKLRHVEYEGLNVECFTHGRSSHKLNSCATKFENEQNKDDQCKNDQSDKNSNPPMKVDPNMLINLDVELGSWILSKNFHHHHNNKDDKCVDPTSEN